MALTHRDLLLPPLGTGDLNPALFPGLDLASLAAQLEQWAREGEGKVLTSIPIPADADADRITALTAGRLVAAKHWAYHKAWMAVWERLVTNPATLAVTHEGSQTFTAEQIAGVRQRAKDALEDYEATVLEHAATRVHPTPYRTRTVSHTFSW